MKGINSITKLKGRKTTILFSILVISLLTLIIPGKALATTPGGIYLTGHDPDFHAYFGASNPAGAQHIIQDAIKYVTFNKVNPKILLVMDVSDPGGGFSDPRFGMVASGFVSFDVADYGSGAPGIKDLHTVVFSNYDVVVVASDFGGWLRQSELDVLNSRSADIINFLNAGGGVVAFAESGQGGLTTHNQFKFLPFVVSTLPVNAFESGNTVTPLGTSIGLTNGDINGNFFHNVFTSGGGMGIVDLDPNNEILSLAERGDAVGNGGVTPPTSIPDFPFSYSLVIMFVAVAAVYVAIRQGMIPNFKRF
ncbi:MAG TPA: hypothetical protein VEU72_01000 [Nitrosopumilaceae archaeon]|nr:hypothetical protein [Nitrosopumilaceae archaeon]